MTFCLDKDGYGKHVYYHPISFDVEVIPHDQQRYPTVGDYVTNDNGAHVSFRISKMDNWKYEFLVAIHEMVERYICYDIGVSEKEIDDFDIEYEKNRKVGDVSEPGDSLAAPYHRAHVFATNFEKQIAEVLGVNWDEYNNYVSSL